ncbi:MAG: hypothetical protein ABIP55_07100 [Tepidisphaeraceae bacterium]
MGALAVQPRPSAELRWGMAAIYLLFLVTYLLTASPLHEVVVRRPVFLPVMAGVGFLAAGMLFQVTLGMTSATRRLITLSVVPTLLLAVALCVVLRARLAWPGLTASLPAVGMGFRVAIMVTIEESIKILPVVALLRFAVIDRAAPAMLAAALSGLAFGMIEAIHHSFFIYGPMGSPLTTYLVRVFVMAPSHGIGAAVAIGLAFNLASRRAVRAAVGRARLEHRGGKRARAELLPRWGELALGFALAVALHAAHNGAQAIFGPAAQIPTVFLPLALLYGLARSARREAGHEASDDDMCDFLPSPIIITPPQRIRADAA